MMLVCMSGDPVPCGFSRAEPKTPVLLLCFPGTSLPAQVLQPSRVVSCHEAHKVL